LLKKDLESIHEENDLLTVTKNNEENHFIIEEPGQKECSVEDDVRTIRKTVRFWYYISFITL